MFLLRIKAADKDLVVDIVSGLGLLRLEPYLLFWLYRPELLRLIRKNFVYLMTSIRWFQSDLRF